MAEFQKPKCIMDTLCRLCAEESSKLTPIFENETLPLKISKCLPIQVNKTDHLPLKVCESCFFKIGESYDLFIKVDEADKRLKRLWKALLKETLADSVESIDCVKNSPVVQIPQDFVRLQEGTESDTSSCVVNVPEEATYQSVEILGDNHMINAVSNKLMIISKAVSFEVISESLILKSSEKSNNVLHKYEMQEEKINELEKKKLDNQVDEMYQCQFCPYQFSTVSSFSAHQATHSEERPYLCDVCGKFFKNAKYLRSHAKIHLNIKKKHICKICSKGFVTNFFLQEHMNSHTGETPYKCLVCEKKFRERIHLRQHKLTHSNKKFVCPICESKFNRKGNMTEHIKHHHKKGAMSVKKAEENIREVSNFKCQPNNGDFPSEVLRSHLKIHPEQKRFCCSMCGKKYRHSGSLTYHRRVAHTGERPFQCSFCDRKFSLRSVQVIHERKTHTYEQPYKCSFCSRPFTNSSSLRNHMYVHAKEKIFNCDDCGKKFSRSSSLIVHKKLHNNDRKFICEQCGKSYIQRHDLLKHQKIHNTISKPFFCKYCGNSFSYKKDSVKHTMCQFDFFRKKQADIFSVEKILDSVTNDLERNGKEFSADEEQELILESVDEFSGGKISKEDFIYGNKGNEDSEENCSRSIN